MHFLVWDLKIRIELGLKVSVCEGHEEFEILPNGQKRYFKDLMSHKEEICKSVRLNGFQEIFSDLQKYVIPKGQKISVGNFDVPKTNNFVTSKKEQK